MHFPESLGHRAIDSLAGHFAQLHAELDFARQFTGFTAILDCHNSWYDRTRRTNFFNELVELVRWDSVLK